MASSYIYGGFLFQEHTDGLVDVAPYPKTVNLGVSLPADHLTGYVLSVLIPGAGTTADRTRAMRRAMFGEHTVPDAVLSPAPEALDRFQVVSKDETGLPDEVVVKGTRVGEAYPYDGSESADGQVVVRFSTLRDFVFSRLQHEAERCIDDADSAEFEALALFVIRGGGKSRVEAAAPGTDRSEASASHATSWQSPRLTEYRTPPEEVLASLEALRSATNQLVSELDSSTFHRRAFERFKELHDPLTRAYCAMHNRVHVPLPQDAADEDGTPMNPLARL